MKPANFQIDAAGFVYERDASLLLCRMGSGKTLINLMAAQDWIESGAAKRVAIVAPLRVAKSVWRQEIAKWQIPLTAALCTGEMTRHQQMKALDAKTDLLIVNYDVYYRLVKAGYTGHCDAVIFDEISKLRNATGKFNKTMRFAPFKLRTGSTGTPAPNGLTSIYGMCRAVGIADQLFGRNHDKWLRKYFYPEDYMQHRWLPFPDTLARFAEILKPYTYVLEDNAVELPPVIRPPIELELPDDLRKQYDEMRKTSMLSDEQIIAGSAGVLYGKLRQLASGIIYANDGERIRLDPYRFEWIQEIVEEQNGQPILIAYEFIEQLAMMRDEWPELRWLGGGSKNDDETIDLWNAGKLDKLAIHPASAGHGLNMQSGGNAIVWWQLPPDLELYDQTLARLARRGQEAQHVYSYEPVALDTIDLTVRAQAHAKARAQDDLWSALRQK